MVFLFLADSKGSTTIFTKHRIYRMPPISGVTAISFWTLFIPDYPNVGLLFQPQKKKLLAAFSDLTLYLYPDGSREIASLNSLQRQILHLMKIPESIYIVPQLVPD